MQGCRALCGLVVDFSVRGRGVLVIDTLYSLRVFSRINRGRNPHQNNSHHQVFSPTATLRQQSAPVCKLKIKFLLYNSCLLLPEIPNKLVVL